VLKILSYLVKRDGMAVEEFVDYYENHHVPLILSLAPPPQVYKRHYLQRGDAVNIGEAGIDFDVVTEQGFADQAAFESWIGAVTAGDAGERVAADEARFLQRSRTRCCVVSDYVTTG
jgi:EthD domain